MAKEYTELQLKAKKEGITSWHVKSDEQLSDDLAAKWKNDANPIVPEDENDETEVVNEAPAGPVTFYWKNGRNVEFSIETKAATKLSIREAEAFASVNSVLVLDPGNPVHVRAIEKLRKSPQFKTAFDEVDHRNTTADKTGAKLDELMELDHGVLVQMVGGSVQDHRKTKGELITQLMS
jgi:hypothetical protein